MKNFLRHTLWQEEFASGRMGRALDILLLFFLLLDLEMTLQTYLPTCRLDFWVWSFSSRRRDG